MGSKYPSMNKVESASAGTWGSYYITFKKRGYKVPPATREELNKATMTFFHEGGKIEYLAPSAESGKLSQTMGAEEFINDEADLPDIFKETI